MTTMEVSTEQGAAPMKTAGVLAQIGETTTARTTRGVTTAGAMMSRSLVTVPRDATLWTAWGLLYGSDERHLVVVDGYRRPVGILDERVVALEWPAGPLAPHRKRVHELLRGSVAAVQPGDDVVTVAKAMLVAGVDALPVTDRSGRLVGLVTTEHVLQHVAGSRPE